MIKRPNTLWETTKICDNFQPTPIPVQFLSSGSKRYVRCVMDVAGLSSSLAYGAASSIPPKNRGDMNASTTLPKCKLKCRRDADSQVMNVDVDVPPVGESRVVRD